MNDNRKRAIAKLDKMIDKHLNDVAEIVLEKKFDNNYHRASPEIGDVKTLRQIKAVLEGKAEFK